MHGVSRTNNSQCVVECILRATLFFLFFFFALTKTKKRVINAVYSPRSSTNKQQSERTLSQHAINARNTWTLSRGHLGVPRSRVAEPCLSSAMRGSPVTILQLRTQLSSATSQRQTQASAPTVQAYSQQRWKRKKKKNIEKKSAPRLHSNHSKPQLWRDGTTQIRATKIKIFVCLLACVCCKTAVLLKRWTNKTNIRCAFGICT